MKLNKKDDALIQEATNVLQENKSLYDNKKYLVAAVLLAKSGKIYKGVNIKTSHAICAEQVALGQALACGEREFDTIVAVKFDETNKKVRVVSPCGVCRYIFDKFGLDLNVIVEDIEHDKVLKVKAKELMPYPYRRQKNQ